MYAPYLYVKSYMFTMQDMAEIFSKFEQRDYIVVGIQLSKKDYNILVNLDDKPVQAGRMWTAQVGILSLIKDGQIKITAQFQQPYGPQDGEVIEETCELYKAQS